MPKNGDLKPAEILKKHYEVVVACNRCGFCTSYCPTYNSSGSESHSPRGRNQAFRAIVEGRLSNPVFAEDIVESCLLCGECTTVCFSEVPTADLMIEARHLLNQTLGIPMGLKFLLGFLLPRPKLFRRLVKLAFMAKRLGISKLLNAVGILKKLAPPLVVGEEFITKVPLAFLLDQGQVRQRTESALEKEKHAVLVAQKKVSDCRKKGKPVSFGLLKASERIVHRPKIAYMPACGSQYIRPSVGESSVELLEILSQDFIIPDLLCCGLPAASYGDLRNVQRFAKENIERLERGNYEFIIMDDSSCTAHLKDYPKYFSQDPQWFNRAHGLVQKIREFSVFLLQKGLREHLAKKNWRRGLVAFHDPCKAQYAQKITQPPRQLLESIPGLKLVSIADADQCCGGGGTYSVVHPEMSREVLAKKIENIKKTQAKVVVTTSASCLFQLDFGMRANNLDIEVQHLSEFLSRVIS